MPNPEHSKDIQNYRELRNKSSERVFCLMVVWVTFIIAVVVLSGFKCFDRIFELDRYVLIALLGTSTANIVSLLFAVIKGSFSDIWKQPTSSSGE